ncbi:hypothetical protein RND71_030923 [Anisodus tanguticus]|uniref:Cation/H+ exchanger domain-containing protein n=1 Tax=Anisodus tanguticus TaxID=243964 RepID=A0AAE1V8R1_9SOLA|nr:hypothetical protein RND71_030923 [Anisodus tanguticus]
MSNAPALRANLVCTSFDQINSRGLYAGDDPLDYSVPSLLLQLSLISVFTRIIQSLLKPLGQPLIVSQILGGVILGPSVIGKNGELPSKVFPSKGKSVLDTVSVFASFTAFLLEKFLSLDQELITLLLRVVVLQSMTAYPGIAFFLDELKILNSDIGRLASSSSIISILWAIKQTPEGKRVKNVDVFIVLVLLLWYGFTGEAIGLSSIVACFLFGLVIPDGQPLGAAIVERLNCFVSVLLAPVFHHLWIAYERFFYCEAENFGSSAVGCVSRFYWKDHGNDIALLFWRVPLRDAFSLALIMNSKCIMELAFLNDFKQNKDVSEENYTIMLISVVVITGVISPLVKVLYDPSRRYIAYKRRTIMHRRENEEFRILSCIHSQENVHAVISLLRVSNPTKESRINLVVLLLTKLTDRASSVLIAHQKCDKPSLNPTQSERIFNAFEKFEQQNSDLIMVQCYKGISPYATMHNDVCSLALEKRTTLVIVPFHKHWIFEKTFETSYAYRHLNKNVLEKAPCSVGILVDRGNTKNLGNSSENIVGGSERSKVLDSQFLNEFNLQFLHSEQVSYQEAEVKCGADVLEVIKSLGRFYDLVVVGKHHVDSPILLQLTKRNNVDGELGLVGEVLAASDFESETSVLVVQQQTRPWRLHDPEESTHLRRIDL